VVLAGFTSGSEVAQASPEAPSGPDAPAAPHPDCHWEQRTKVGQDWRYLELVCANGVDPKTLLRDQLPPAPGNCRQETVGRGDKPALPQPGEPQRPAGTRGRPRTKVWKCTAADDTVWFECQDMEKTLGQDWLDPDHKDQVQIPAHPRPEDAWWYEEIKRETEDAKAGKPGNGCELAKHPPAPPCKDRELTNYRSESGLIPDRCWGNYPSKHYAINWSSGEDSDFTDTMLAWLGTLMFSLGKGAIVSVLWLVGWAFSFNIKDYTTFAYNIAESYQVSIVEGFNLQDMVWFALVAWAGMTALRGKLGAAGAEILVAIVMAGVFTVIYQQRAVYMNELATLLDETSARMLVAGRHRTCIPPDQKRPTDRVVDENPSVRCRPDEVLVEADATQSVQLLNEIRPLQQRIHQSFVEEPYAYLSWGRIITDQCLKAQNHIIATGYNGDGWPARHMQRADDAEDAKEKAEAEAAAREHRPPRPVADYDCDAAGDFNRKPSDERMLGALLTMLAAWVVAFFLGLMSLTVVVSKFLVAVLFALSPFAAVAAILPGAARRAAWSWFGTLLQLSVGVVSMSFLLSLMLLGVSQVLRSTENIELVQRWFVVFLIAGAVYFARRKLLSSSKGLGETLTDSLVRMTPAGAVWRGQSQHMDMLGMDRGLARGGQGVLTVANAGRRVVAQRMAENRAARKSLRNLEKMERGRERGHVKRVTTTATDAAPALAAGATVAGALGGGDPSRNGARPSRGQHRGNGRTTNRGYQGRHRQGGRPNTGPSSTGPSQPNGGSQNTGPSRGSTSVPRNVRPNPAPRPPVPRQPVAPRRTVEYVVEHTYRNPASFLRNPVRAVSDRMRHGTPVFGTRAQADRLQGHVDRVNARRSHGWS
jgi:hypothetical protein